MLTVQSPLVTPDFALRDTIVVLAGVVVGGLNRPIPATLGGFSIGFATGVLGGALPTNQSQYLPTFIFAAVILVLLVRPAGSSTSRGPWSAYEARLRLEELLGPVALVVAAALLGTLVSISTQTYFIDTLVKVSIVVALYVFIGNSGVLSFGHISFVALGAWTAGVLSVPTSEKPAIMPNLAHFLVHRTRQCDLARGRCDRRRNRRVRGRDPADAALRARRRHRDVCRARDHAQPPHLRGAHRPGTERVFLRARDDRPPPGGDRSRCLHRDRVRVRPQPVRTAAARDARGRRGRAGRRRIGLPPASDRVHRSGLLAGLAGGLYVHLLPVQINSVYLDLTFITLAMLVVGGTTSLFGAVVGALAVSALDSWLAVAENGTSLFGWHIDLPAGTREIVVGVLMAAVLILRPSGLTGGRELRLRGVAWRGFASRARA